MVFRHHGTVDKFVGDMVMALFGAPVEDPRMPSTRLLRPWRWSRFSVSSTVNGRPKGKSLRYRYRREFGEMIAGNIGSTSIMSYTVIGDNVNLGSRLESLNKDFRTRIIISDATRTRLQSDYTSGPSGTSRSRARPARWPSSKSSFRLRSRTHQRTGIHENSGLCRRPARRRRRSRSSASSATSRAKRASSPPT